MPNYFSIKEFCITPQLLTIEVADAIFMFHILPMNVVRKKHGRPIKVSLNSGYRPEDYELGKGRSGTSEHCFKTLWPMGQGAADYTSRDLPGLVKLLMKYTKYTRITYYKKKNFIHCDFKHIEGGKRAYYEADSRNKWILKKYFI